MNGVFESNDLNIFVSLEHDVMSYPPMFHTHAEIFCLLSGHAEIFSDGHRRVLEPGDVAVIFPYSIHEYAKAQGITAFLVMFQPEACPEFEHILTTYKPCNPFLTNINIIQTILKQLKKHIDKNAAYSLKTAHGYLTALVGEIISRLELTDTSKTDITTIQKIIKYCFDNYRSDITLKKISQDLLISTNTISLFFSEKLKISFRDYINSLRINYAKDLLKKRAYTITEIMYACGYKNQSSFNRIFQSLCGKTPREYRNENELEVN